MSIRDTFRDRAFLTAFAEGVVMIILGLAAIAYSTSYANISISNSVTDLILSNTRVYDVDVIFVYGALAAILFSIIIMLTIEVRRAPFVLKTVAIFLIIRSIFVSLTHISPYPTHAVLSESFLSSYRFFQTIFASNDLFFSLHAGLPFMMALLLWDRPVLRYIYLITSVVLGIVVLLGHLHYSIDVFGAYFITYSIYAMGLYLFKNDYERAVS